MVEYPARSGYGEVPAENASLSVRRDPPKEPEVSQDWKVTELRPTVKGTLAIHDETILFGLGRTPTCILYLTNQLADWIRRGMPGISGFALPSGVPVAAP